ncbi:MAG: hypothetical protein ACJ8FY_09430 [Gemmataceae bacterium]
MRADIKTKEARFRVKADQKCDIEEVKKAVAESGKYSVTKVETPKTTPKGN